MPVSVSYVMLSLHFVLSPALLSCRVYLLTVACFFGPATPAFNDTVINLVVQCTLLLQGRSPPFSGSVALLSMPCCY
jgi:hypothetical protein